MPRRTQKHSTHKLIAFKAYFDDDSDILTWWEGINEGDRSNALRDVIREYLGRQPRRTRLLTIPELLEVRQDTLWIRDALNEMPGYLERLVQHLAASSAVQFAMPPTAGSSTDDVPPTNEPALSNTDSERRARRMKQSQW